MRKVLLLNASYEVLGTVTVPRAVSFLIAGRAVPLGDSVMGTIKHPTGEIPRPHIVRLVHYVKVPTRARRIPWSRQNVRRRDGFTCGYCGSYGDTVDHILPKAQGGGNAWENTITACGSCNFRKGSRTPKEAGMKLLFQPAEPSRSSATLESISAEQRATLEEYGLLEAAAAQ